MNERELLEAELLQLQRELKNKDVLVTMLLQKEIKQKATILLLHAELEEIRKLLSK
jgi:hypothetical protein